MPNEKSAATMFNSAICFEGDSDGLGQARGPRGVEEGVISVGRGVVDVTIASLLNPRGEETLLQISAFHAVPGYNYGNLRSLPFTYNGRLIS
jgi:hypothetical protein